MSPNAKIKRYLWKALGITLLVASSLTFLMIQVIFMGNDGLEAKQGVFLFSLMGLGWVFILSIASLSVFFNLDPFIRQNMFNSFLSFYFNPLLAVIFVVVETDDLGSVDMLGKFLTANIPFFAVYSYFFIKFRNTDFEELTN